MRALVVNSGSSSVKYELFDADHVTSLLQGEIERIGSSDASAWVSVPGPEAAGQRAERPVQAADHAAAFGVMLATLAATGALRDVSDLAVVGHRVVHGGSAFTGPVVIDDRVVDGIREVALLAPLHTSANLAGIEAARAALPGVVHVAVFDTAFHSEMPQRAREYALPRELVRDHGIRRYGFHGTSFAYVSRRAAAFLGKPLGSLDMIVLHLGNGASACAIKGGKSLDTSMGMTPLEGLVMGTRCGDVDPAVPLLIREVTGLEREDVHRVLNHDSGLAGMCGESDMRAVHRLVDAGDPDAAMALEVYCYRAAKYVGAYATVLGRLDALVFTAGIGENDPVVRSRICDNLGVLGIGLDEGKNGADASGDRAIHGLRARVSVLVIPTDEEAEIARLSLACVRATGSRA
jgi:acetate kinase